MSATESRETKPIRVTASVVMDLAMLEKAKAKANQHDITFSEFLEKAVKLYGRVLDHRVVVVTRPV